jgi:hypothetical protein
MFPNSPQSTALYQVNKNKALLHNLQQGILFLIFTIVYKKWYNKM